MNIGMWIGAGMTAFVAIVLLLSFLKKPVGSLNTFSDSYYGAFALAACIALGLVGTMTFIVSLLVHIAYLL